MNRKHDWVYIGVFPDRSRHQHIFAGLAHIWAGLAVACQVEDYGLIRPADDQTPRCAECVRWLVGA